MKALSIVVSTSLFTYTCNFARNFFPVFKGIFVSLMLAMKFAGKKKQRIQVRFAMALSKSFQTSSEFMQPGVDIWYMTENMAAQVPKKLHSTLQLVDTKVASYQKRQRKSALRN